MPGSDGAEPNASRVAKILVVDDEPNNRLLLTAILEHAGYDLIDASDGGQALELARASRPDLIIIDLYMPGMSGVDFVKELRADADIGATRVALYTATSSDESLHQFMELAGIECIIAKPSEPQEVLRAVEAALSG